MTETPKADMLLSDALSDLVEIVERESDHEGMRAEARWITTVNQFELEARCHACGKSWTIAFPGSELAKRRTINDLVQFFRKDVVPFFQKITKSDCYELCSDAMLAEWITETLTKAGPAGLPYIQVMHQANEERLAPPEKVDTMLRKLGFLMEWVPIKPLVPATVLRKMQYDPEWRLPLLRLPTGHPRCTWTEEEVPA